MTAASETTRAAEVRRAVAELVHAEMERDVDPAVDLFDQGITSLSFLRVVARTNERYGVAVDATQLEEASVDTLSELVASNLNAETSVASATGEDGR